MRLKEWYENKIVTSHLFGFTKLYFKTVKKIDKKMEDKESVTE